MEQYISKATVVAEIEGRLKVLYKDRDFNYLQIKELETLLSFLGPLEVKEEILDEEGKIKLMKKCVHKAYKRGYDMGVLKTTNEMNHNMKEVNLKKEFYDFLDTLTGKDNGHLSEDELFRIAEYFYELGLTQKGE